MKTFIGIVLIEKGYITMIGCFLVSYLFNAIVSNKHRWDPFRYLTPIISALVGIITLIITPIICYEITYIVDRIFIGFIFGLATTGLVEMVKRTYRFFRFRSIIKDFPGKANVKIENSIIISDSNAEE